jgi:Domain of unknown function (DUF5658)
MLLKCFAASLIGLLLFAASARAADDGVVADSGVVIKLKAAEPRNDRGVALTALYGTLVGLQVYDGWSTLNAARRGAIETNPLAATLVSNPGAFWALKIGATSASIYAVETLWRRNHRTQAIATMLAVNGIMVAVAARNTSVMHEMK